MCAIKIGMLSIPRLGNPEVTRQLYANFGFEVFDLSRRDIGRGSFRNADILHCPGGHHVVLSQQAIVHLKNYIHVGHGVIGICAGAHFIAHAQLLEMDACIVRAEGIYSMRVVQKHPVVKGFRKVPRSPERKGLNPVPHSNIGRISIHRGNGGYLLPKDKSQIIATYDNDDKFAGIVAGLYGEGRVVAFSGHPYREVKYDDNLKTDPKVTTLLKNAALWCAKAF